MDPSTSGALQSIGGAALQPQRIVPFASHSRIVQRIRRRYAAELALLPAGLPERAAVTALVERLRGGGRSLAAALRVARQLTLERLAVLDIEEGASLADITRAMTELAEATLELALAQALADQDARHGVPRDGAGERIDFWIVGMGKLGARELNVSSDIDLVYLYESDGHTDGAKPISAHEYFAQVARSLYTLIGEVTDDGFVFRVDLALRPNGNSGPTVVSLAMLEEYLQAHGREWERFAWLKSRVVAPRASVESGRATPLKSLVTAFVYRRYLDYGVFEGLRQLHLKVRDEAQRRAAGRPERANDVKLSRGGIREIEFIVQLLLVVRGGQFPEIRTRSTLKALDKLAAGGLMQRATSERLADAYAMLRRVEHRIQYLDDQQTHVLPTHDGDLAWIAKSLGHDDEDGVCTMLQLLGVARESVADEFDRLLHDSRRPGAGNANACKTCGPAPLPIDAEQFLVQLPAELRARVEPLCGQPKIRLLRDESKVRLARLISRAADAVSEARCTLHAATLFIDWLEPLLRRESYLALLWERPGVHERLLRLLGAARWPARYLLQHPGVIDELAGAQLLSERFSAQDLEADLEDRRRSLQRTGEDDDEALLNLLRRAYHAEVFRTLARDVEGCLTVEQVADDLSALADTVLRVTARWCWQRLKQRHREAPQFAIIGYGKLGGKELGYGSDLDIVFVYEDDDERAPEAYGAFVRKLINWLSTKTAEGDLFEIDTALRPNGSSGLLITTFEAYANYQQQRGSNTAWTWEHQAMTRARFVLGMDSLAPRFDAVREAVITAPRDDAALRREIVAMREKVAAARPVKADRFDVKHSPGGMVDAEFAVQYLVLAQSGQHRELIPNVGNIALLQRAEAAGLLPTGVGDNAAQAYRELRRVQHQARLNEETTQLPADALASQRQAVMALWQAVFG